MSFDLSFFPKIGKWLFNIGIKLFEMLEFDFGSFSFNGWYLILGAAVFCIVIFFLGRISE